MSETNKPTTAQEAVESILGKDLAQRVSSLEIHAQIAEILNMVAARPGDPMSERARQIMATGFAEAVDPLRYDRVYFTPAPNPQAPPETDVPRVVVEVARDEPTRVYSNVKLDVHILDHDSFDTEYFMDSLKARSIDGMAEVESRTNDYDEEADWQDDPMGDHHGRNE